MLSPALLPAWVKVIVFIGGVLFFYTLVFRILELLSKLAIAVASLVIAVFITLFVMHAVGMI